VILTVLPGRLPAEADIARLAVALTQGDTKRRIVVDLSRLEKTSTELLARLVFLNKRVQPVTGRIELWGLSPGVREILHRTHIDTLFEIPKPVSTASHGFLQTAAVAAAAMWMPLGPC
jgi:anti-anti-sigma regulatory factor